MKYKFEATSCSDCPSAGSNVHRVKSVPLVVLTQRTCMPIIHLGTPCLLVYLGRH